MSFYFVSVQFSSVALCAPLLVFLSVQVGAVKQSSEATKSPKYSSKTFLPFVLLAHRARSRLLLLTRYINYLSTYLLTYLLLHASWYILESVALETLGLINSYSILFLTEAAEDWQLFKDQDIAWNYAYLPTNFIGRSAMCISVAFKDAIAVSAYKWASATSTNCVFNNNFLNRGICRLHQRS